MRMTVNQLQKRLNDLIKRGYGRVPVAINKDTFRHNCELDGVVILEVAGVGVRSVTLADPDGGTAFTKAGQERQRDMVLLVGDAGANHKGEIVES